MTNEELRLAIAKAKGHELGYSYELYAEVKLGDPVPDAAKHLMYLYTDSEYSDGSPIWVEAPNWPTSIADVWELVEEIPVDQHGKYILELVKIITRDCKSIPDYMWQIAHATPRQRCEAYLAWKAQP